MTSRAAIGLLAALAAVPVVAALDGCGEDSEAGTPTLSASQQREQLVRKLGADEGAHRCQR